MKCFSILILCPHCKSNSLNPFIFKDSHVSHLKPWVCKTYISKRNEGLLWRGWDGRLQPCLHPNTPTWHGDFQFSSSWADAEQLKEEGETDCAALQKGTVFPLPRKAAKLSAEFKFPVTQLFRSWSHIFLVTHLHLSPPLSLINLVTMSYKYSLPICTINLPEDNTHTCAHRWE